MESCVGHACLLCNRLTGFNGGHDLRAAASPDPDADHSSGCARFSNVGLNPANKVHAAIAGRSINAIPV
jgi:hypothetical protein